MSLPIPELPQGNDSMVALLKSRAVGHLLKDAELTENGGVMLKFCCGFGLVFQFEQAIIADRTEGAS